MKKREEQTQEDLDKFRLLIESVSEEEFENFFFENFLTQMKRNTKNTLKSLRHFTRFSNITLEKVLIQSFTYL